MYLAASVWIMLFIVLNCALMSDSEWVTYEEFFKEFRKLQQAHIIDIPDRPCTAIERKIGRECRRVY